jgi:hypothetical protein
MFTSVFRKLKRRRSSLKPCGQTLIFAVRWHFNRRRETIPLYQGFAQLLGEPFAVTGVAALKTMMRGLLLGYRRVPDIGDVSDWLLTRDEEIILQIVHSWQRKQPEHAIGLTGKLIDPRLQPVFSQGASTLASLLQAQNHHLLLPWSCGIDTAEYLPAASGIPNKDRSRISS